jgi:hypothetical protein
MHIHRCPQCSIPYVDDEIEQGVCPGCKAPLARPLAPTPRDVPTQAQTAAPFPSRAMPFLLGLLVGCLIGLAALWVALRLDAPLPGGVIEQTAAFQTVQSQKTQADNQALESEAGRQAAESRDAEAVKALDAANRQEAAVRKQKDDGEQRLKDALARLAEEQGRRVSLEKAIAKEKKPAPVPALSFVRDWQLLGPFASTGDQGHDTVYPPEREPVQLDTAYDGFAGPLKWRPYHSNEDKIDLADFFLYRAAGVAYAVSWVYSDRDQAVTLGVGSDDGVRVWVNREKIFDIKGGRQAKPGQDVIKAHLREGWNEILAKVDNIVGTWELYLEIRTADGGQPLKVFSTSSPPPAARK